MTVREFKEKVYEEFKDEINLISKASIDEEKNWQADVGVATDMFLTNIENEGTYPYVNKEKALARITELRALIDTKETGIDPLS